MLFELKSKEGVSEYFRISANDLFDNTDPADFNSIEVYYYKTEKVETNSLRLKGFEETIISNFNARSEVASVIPDTVEYYLYGWLNGLGLNKSKNLNFELYSNSSISNKVILGNFPYETHFSRIAYIPFTFDSPMSEIILKGEYAYLVEGLDDTVAITRLDEFEKAERQELVDDCVIPHMDSLQKTNWDLKELGGRYTVSQIKMLQTDLAVKNEEAFFGLLDNVLSSTSNKIDLYAKETKTLRDGATVKQFAFVRYDSAKVEDGSLRLWEILYSNGCLLQVEERFYLGDNETAFKVRIRDTTGSETSKGLFETEIYKILNK